MLKTTSVINGRIYPPWHAADATDFRSIGACTVCGLANAFYGMPRRGVLHRKFSTGAQYAAPHGMHTSMLLQLVLDRQA